MGNNKPSGGYPTKSLHIKALWNAGVSTREIADLVDVSEASIYPTINRLRNSGHDDIIDRPKGKRGASTDNRGLWTPEKLSKARRLFGKCMIYIAEALQVPPKELMDYGLNGVLPPMGKGQRVAQLLEERREPAEEEVAPEPPPAPPVEQPVLPPPSRDDDEAELAQLEEEEEPDEDADGGDGAAGGLDDPGGAPTVAPAVAAALRVTPRTIDGSGSEADTGAEEEAEAETPAEDEPPAAEKPRRYRITDGAGRYVLAAPGKGMTLNKALAWSGTAQELEQLFKQWPALKDLDPERIP